MFGNSGFRKLLSFSFFHLLERDRDRMSRGGAERERRRERIPSRLHTASAEPDTGLEFMNCEIMT